jgi:DNA-binding response OmpR family regulator
MTPKPSGAMSGEHLRARPRVLIVDDDSGLAALLGSWLSDMADVYTATTSAQALALAAVVPPDLAVVDVVLPRMDGFDLVLALRRQPELTDMPVIFITGSDRLDIWIRADELKGASVQFKPIQQEALQEAILGLLRPPPAAV